MEDEEGSAPLDGKGLGNLRVVDLKQELEKRGLSKSGSKKDLVKRLKLNLEFEKLCEERKSSGDEQEIEFDAATEQNECVQQHLAEEQKRLEVKRHASEANQKLNEKQVSTDEKENLVLISDDTGDDNSNRNECIESNELSKTDSEGKNYDANLQVAEVNTTDVKSPSASKSAETKDSAIAIKISVVNKHTFERKSSVDSSKSHLCASGQVYEHLQVPISPVDSLESIHESNQVSKSPADASRNKCILQEASVCTDEDPQIVYEQSKIPKSPPNVLESVCEEPINLENFADISENVHKQSNSTKSSEDPENIYKQLKVSKSSVDVSYDVKMEQNNSLSISNISDRTDDCCSNISFVHPVENERSIQKNILPVINSSDTENVKFYPSIHSSHISDSREVSNNPSSTYTIQNIKPNKIKIIIRHRKSEKESDSTADTLDDIKEGNKTLSNVQHCEEIENIPGVKAETGISDTSEKECAMDSPMTKKISSDHPCKQVSVSNMESSQSSSVPYSLSDITLPGSPGNLSAKSSNPAKNEENSSKLYSSDNEATKDSPLGDKGKSNGVSEADTVSRHGETSDSESSKSDNSAAKSQKIKKKYSSNKLKNKSSSSRQSAKSESSSEEAVRNKSQPGEKMSKFKDKSSVDAKERSKDFLDRKQQSEDSENESHSEGERRGRVDSKRKSNVDRRSKYSRQQSDDSENEKKLDSRHKSKSKSDRRRKSSRQHSEERGSRHKSKDSADKKKYSRQQSEDNERGLESRHKFKDNSNRRQKSSRHRSEDRENEKCSDSKYKFKSNKDREQKSSRQKSEDRESEESLDSKPKDTDKKQESEDGDNGKSLGSKHKSKDTARRQHSEDRDNEKNSDLKHKYKGTDRRQHSEDKSGRPLISSRQQFENSENESSVEEHSCMDSKHRSSDSADIKHTSKQKYDSENQKNSNTEKNISIESKQESSDNIDKEQKVLKPQFETENESLGDEHSVKDSKNKLKNVDQRPKSPKDHSEESEKSSDSGNFPSHTDSQHKLTGSLNVERRRSHSQSSSSSRSSDSNSKRRRSKKSILVPKNSDIESDKNLVEKSKEHRNISVETPPKKRIKIKRDNISVENLTSNIESRENSTSNKSVEKAVMSSSRSVSDKPESTELESHEIPYVPRKVSLSNRKLNRKSSEDTSTETKIKKSKWGSFASAQKSSQTISISTDSLKNWFPDFKLISEPTTPMELEPEELHFLPTTEEKPHSSHIDPFDGNGSGVKQASSSQVSVDAGELKEPSVEEISEKGPVSKIIFIQNLVRPFTLNQLKDILKQNGNIVEEFFWIDKIKSKCFVMYETEKDACRARNSLNNTRWPSSNPKILSVEFSSVEECEQHKKGNEPPPKPIAEPIVEHPEMIETRDYPMDEPRRKDRERRKERERSKPQLPIREWDKDKIIQESPEREPLPKEDKPRSSEKDKKKESKKRPNEDTSAKLLDHLFQKTKSAPCIYWLPLTEEQAKQKEEAIKIRKMEREKRNQMKEQEEAERRNKRARSSRRSREKENRKSSTRSRSPVTRRR